MDAFQRWIAVLTVVVAVVGALAVVGQFLNQRAQRRVAEAEANFRQATQWAALAPDWDRCVLVATAGAAPWRYGISSSQAKDLLRAVERYRRARVAFNDVMRQSEVDGSAWDSLLSEEGLAKEELAEYMQSVQRVITHLAQLANLVLRRQLTIEAVYGAIGPACVRVGDDLLRVLKMNWAHNEGCVAPDNEERRLWERLSAEQAVQRIGWGDFLDVARGTAERVVLLLDLLMSSAVRIGDLTAGSRIEQDYPGAELSDVDRLAVAWRAAKPFGRLRAARVVINLSTSGRSVMRRYKWGFPLARPRWLNKLSRLVRMKASDAFTADWIYVLRDNVLVFVDLSRAISRSRTVPDIRRLEQPKALEDL